MARAQPAVKRIWVNNIPYPYVKDAPVSLEFSRKNLSIEFSPAAGDSSVIAFRIPALDSAWQFSDYPVFNIYGLSGGEYILEAKETAGAGRELRQEGALLRNAAGKTAVLRIPIHVQQAFWQKWWFWPTVILYGLLLVGIGIYLFFLYDFRQKLKIAHVRNRIASDLHDEVGSNLNSIAIFAELLRKKMANNTSLLPILDRITSNSEETVTLMRDTVWAINPENDSLEKLIEKMRAFGVEILTAKGISFHFNAEDLKTLSPMSMEQRRNLYLVYKEAVNNIAKHSDAREAGCILEKEGGVLKVLVKDDGKGFDPSSSFEGNGLRNFIARGREDHMLVEVSSAPGKGTTVMIKIGNN